MIEASKPRLGRNDPGLITGEHKQERDGKSEAPEGGRDRPDIGDSSHPGAERQAKVRKDERCVSIAASGRGVQPHQGQVEKCSRRASIASAALAASPPLFFSSGLARVSA